MGYQDKDERSLHLVLAESACSTTGSLPTATSSYNLRVQIVVSANYPFIDAM